jgi:hypothetical protein
MTAHAGTRPINLRKLAELLRSAAGVSQQVDSLPELQRLAGGANNAVFRAVWAGRSYLLKQFFSHPRDPRDRYGAEVAFVEFAWEHGLRALPRLLARCSTSRLAVFEFIDGRSVRAEDIDADLIGQAVGFLQELFAAQASCASRSLPPAAESCFSLSQHLACVDRRIERLAAIRPESDLDQETHRLVKNVLRPRWREVRHAFNQACLRSGRSLVAELGPEERCLSPSDFGFHNAMLETGGRLRFLDFEYAGWDDPAKLLCDFHCQVELPVSRPLWQEFLGRILELLPHADRVAWRVERLLPVYQLKWCCIVLNEFLPEGRARRQFSAADRSGQRQPEIQLAKARHLLEQVKLPI